MSTDRRTRAWVEVDAAAVRRNLRTIAAALPPGAGVIPMVKADAYGLGVDRTVATLEPEEPLAWGVATVNEGRHLRRLGVTRPILVCSPLPPGAYGDAVEDTLTVCVSDLGGLDRLREAAARAGRRVDFHVEVDTGMGRAGFDWRDAVDWGRAVSDPGPLLRWTGCMTHLHSADLIDPASVRAQAHRLSDALARLRLPDDAFMVHVPNSAGALRSGTGITCDAGRPGIFLYGGLAGEGLPEPDPAVSLRARVVFVRDAPPGTTLGYGATYTAARRERWATLGIGYGDGYRRALGNRGEVILRGRRAPIIGRISMDVTVVNISGIEGVEVGHVATLIGTEGRERITLDEVAGQVGTISYEVLTGLSRRLPRVWIDADDG